ncbi:unnamed protein product [Chrysodeixis includens]|uniref:Uncharacterized protein n=1 Tax=Chrysodeixis includens TaxID=689277 RepID=A0A9N8Q006_CHRIL|nr:unnamed protein product [Chrysodeixis includens]
MPLRYRTRATHSTLSYQQLLDKQGTKDRFNFAYNPSWGLEAYWAEGEHVLATTTPDPRIPTEKIPKVCDGECAVAYRKIEHVCAHKSDYQTVHGCEGFYCYGKPGDNLDPGFKTFNSYCEFLDAECKNKFNEGRWSLIYIGKCKKVEQIFLPLWIAHQPANRMTKYIQDYYSRHPTTTTESTVITTTDSSETTPG